MAPKQMRNSTSLHSSRARNEVISVLWSSAPDRAIGKRTAIAMSRIYAYLKAARKQVRAIEAFEKNADPKKPPYSSTMIQALIHAHLYFICWAAIGRMIEVIRRGSGLEAPNKVWKKYRIELKCYAEARDHFEHYEERLPGGKKSTNLVNPDDYGSLHYGWFSLGGYRWDVSKESLMTLEHIVTELDESMCREASDALKGQVNSLSTNRS